MFSKVKNYIEHTWERNYFKDGKLTEDMSITDEELFLAGIVINKEDRGTAVGDIDKKVIGFIFEDTFTYILLENINLFNDVLKYFKKHKVNVLLTDVPVDTEINPLKSIKLFHIGSKSIAEDFDIKIEITNIVKEVYRLSGLESKEIEKKTEDFMSTIDIPEDLPDDAILRFLGNLVVIAIGGIFKKNYEPIKVLREIAKEINSLTGETINGKFVKCEIKKCKSKWYRADFTKCKLDEDFILKRSEYDLY